MHRSFTIVFIITALRIIVQGLLPLSLLLPRVLVQAREWIYTCRFYAMLLMGFSILIANWTS